MDREKKRVLEAAGFRVGDAGDFLGLTEEERRYVELRVKLSQVVRDRRQGLRLTQEQLARKLDSSQSRVAKLEAAAPDISLDMLFRSLFAVGGDLSDLTGRAAERPSSKPAPQSSARGASTAKKAQAAKAKLRNKYQKNRKVKTARAQDKGQHAAGSASR